mgnify:CR=1 FL=1
MHYPCGLTDSQCFKYFEGRLGRLLTTRAHLVLTITYIWFYKNSFVDKLVLINVTWVYTNRVVKQYVIITRKFNVIQLPWHNITSIYYVSGRCSRYKCLHSHISYKLNYTMPASVLELCSLTFTQMLMNLRRCNRVGNMFHNQRYFECRPKAYIGDSECMLSF